MAVKFVYVTIGCADEAEQLAAEIINKQLAACANIIPGMTSVFKWNGKIQTSSETIILFKTTKACTESLINRIKELHSFECPCIATLPVEGGEF